MAVARRATEKDATWARAWTVDTLAELADLSDRIGPGAPRHGDSVFVVATGLYYLWQDNGSWAPQGGGSSGGPHHVTHETGGTDEITSLPASVLTSGNIPAARLPVTAASRLLGRGASAPGAAEEITLGTNLAMSGTTLNATGGGGGADLDYSGAYAPGTYNDGDIVVAADGIAYLCVKSGVTTPPEPWPGVGVGPEGGGDVVGPGAATDSAVALFDGTTGKLLKNSSTLLTAFGNVSGPASATADAVAVFNGTTGKLIKNSTLLASAIGNVVGPASATAESVAVFDGTTGKLLKSAGPLTNNIAVKDGANVFTANQKIAKAQGALLLSDTAQGTDLKGWKLTPFVNLYFQTVNDSDASIANPLFITRTGDVAVLRDIYEKGRAAPLGQPIAVPYATSNFSAGGSLTFTVEAGDVVGNSYALIGKMLFWTFNFGPCTLSGTPNNSLFVKIPGGFMAASQATGMCKSYDASGPWFLHTVAAPGPGADYVQLVKLDFSDWNLNTNSTYIQCTGIAIPIL